MSVGLDKHRLIGKGKSLAVHFSEQHWDQFIPFEKKSTRILLAQLLCFPASPSSTVLIIFFFFCRKGGHSRGEPFSSGALLFMEVSRLDVIYSEFPVGLLGSKHFSNCSSFISCEARHVSCHTSCVRCFLNKFVLQSVVSMTKHIYLWNSLLWRVWWIKN